MYRRCLSLYARSVEVLDRATMVFCAGVLALVVALNAVEIFNRYFLGRSSPFLVELAVTLATAMSFVGYLILLKRDEDVAMEYFYRRFSERGRRWLDMLTALAILGFFALLLAKAFDLYRLTSQMMHPVFPVKQSYTVLPVLVAAMTCLWVALYKALLSVERLVRCSR